MNANLQLRNLYSLHANYFSRKVKRIWIASVLKEFIERAKVYDNTYISEEKYTNDATFSINYNLFAAFQSLRMYKTRALDIFTVSEGCVNSFRNIPELEIYAIATRYTYVLLEWNIRGILWWISTPTSPIPLSLGPYWVISK